MTNALHVAMFVFVLVVCVGYSWQQPPCEEQLDNTGPVADVRTNNVAGQSFTSACDGPLGDFVFLLTGVHNRGTVEVEARVYAGTNWPANPGNDPGLGVVTTTVKDGDTSVTFDFSRTGAMLAIGNNYAIRVVGVDGAVDLGLAVFQPPQGPYAGGTFLSTDEITGQGFVSRPFDLAFRYFIAVPPPGPSCSAEWDVTVLIV